MSYRFQPDPVLHTIKHPHLRLVTDSPVLINNFFFAPRPWFFFLGATFSARISFIMCQLGSGFFSIVDSSIASCFVSIDSAKSLAKKEKAQPKNCLPHSMSYRRSCSHFNYYLIPGEEHVATRAIPLPPTAG